MTELRQVHECNICGADPDKWKLIFNFNKEQNLYQCTVCRLYFNDYQRIDYENIYPDSFFEKTTESGTCGGFFNYPDHKKAAQKMYAGFADLIIRRSRDNQNYKLLDIGCSYGFFLELFNHKPNFEKFGVELNKKAAARAKKIADHLYDIPIEKFDVEDKFHFITMFELIEHVIDPKGLLIQVKQMLEKEGYILVSTPDAGSFFFRLLGKKWPSIHPAAHNFYFNSSNFQLLAEKCGLEVVSITSAQFLWSDVFHLRKRLAEIFPKIKALFSPLRLFDRMIIPFISGGDLRIILRKKGSG
jgi:SAM-dependent methyltransferase